VLCALPATGRQDAGSKKMTMAEQGQGGGCAVFEELPWSCDHFIDLARVPSDYRLVVLSVYTGKGRHAISQTVSIVRI
jgi:hypothetical protein